MTSGPWPQGKFSGGRRRSSSGVCGPSWQATTRRLPPLLPVVIEAVRFSFLRPPCVSAWQPKDSVILSCALRIGSKMKNKSNKSHHFDVPSTGGRRKVLGNSQLRQTCPDSKCPLGRAPLLRCDATGGLLLKRPEATSAFWQGRCRVHR